MILAIGILSAVSTVAWLAVTQLRTHYHEPIGRRLSTFAAAIGATACGIVGLVAAGHTLGMSLVIDVFAMALCIAAQAWSTLLAVVVGLSDADRIRV